VIRAATTPTSLSGIPNSVPASSSTTLPSVGGLGAPDLVFTVPSGAMEPTIKTGDTLAVTNKFTSLARGEVIIFNKPPADTEPGGSQLIKRIIGLPGDVVGAEGGYYYIDGEKLDESWLPQVDQGSTCGPPSAPPNCAPFGPLTVPAGGYFVSGDNRTDSYDSRYFGPISGSLVVGVAISITAPIGDVGSLLP
jgi:signal peptidase I